MKPFVYGLIIASFVVHSLTGCKKVDPRPLQENQKNKESTLRNNNGLKIKITDSPGDYQSLQIEIVKLEVFIETIGWKVLSENPQVFNVLALTNGTERLLWQRRNVSNGIYSKVRLTFGSRNHIVVRQENMIPGTDINESIMYPLAFVGGNELTVDINTVITYSSDETILLDFDVATSVWKDREGFMLKPSITLIRNLTTGIKGDLDGVASAEIIVSNGFQTQSTHTNNRGEFLIRGLNPGEYSVHIIPSAVNESGFPRPTREATDLDGVMVLKSRIANLGNIPL